MPLMSPLKGKILTIDKVSLNRLNDAIKNHEIWRKVLKNRVYGPRSWACKPFKISLVGT